MTHDNGYDGPIIDVHLHAYPPDEPIDPDLRHEDSGLVSGVADGHLHLQACLAEMRRHHIVHGVVSGGTGDRLAAALHWVAADPDRFTAGVGIRGSADIPLPDLGHLRRALAGGGFGVLGEVTAQYAGLTLSDELYEPSLALAEELDVPVVVHTGQGPAEISFDPHCRGFRAALGNPIHLEEALNRHRRLRVSLMHAGRPFLQETIAVLDAYPQVYADLGWLAWGLPREEFHYYLHALTRAGLTSRLMFGSDQMFWPGAIGRSVEGVISAPWLTPADKRSIFYANAVRFYRLSPVSRGG